MEKIILSLKNQLFDLIITVLLISQVVLSFFIVIKLTNLEQIRMGNWQGGTQPAEYVEDVSADDDPVIGNPKSPLVIIEFGDYQCPYCKKSEAIIKKILNEYPGKVALVFRDFPLDSHTNAFMLANAAECANEQGLFWEVHDLLYENQENIENINSIISIIDKLPVDKGTFSECVSMQKYKEEIINDIVDGQKYQVSGVPTFFINGHRIVGGSYEQIKLAIDKQLK